MLADRINTVEGVIDDLVRGRAPNPLVEMGVVKQSRSRESAIATAAVIGLAAIAVVALARRRR